MVVVTNEALFSQAFRLKFGAFWITAWSSDMQCQLSSAREAETLYLSLRLLTYLFPRYGIVDRVQPIPYFSSIVCSS